MANPEYLTNSSFYLDIDQVQDIVIQKVSGVSIEMKVAAGSGAIGSMKDGKTQTQATPGAVSYGSAVKIEYVAGNEASQQTLTDWYKKCHATSFSGGATQSRSNRYTASLFVYDLNGNIKYEMEFQDIFPANLTQTTQLDVGQAGELAKDTLELRFTKCIRKLQ